MHVYKLMQEVKPVRLTSVSQVAIFKRIHKCILLEKLKDPRLRQSRKGTVRDICPIKTVRINGSLSTEYVGFLPLYVTDPRELSFRHIFPSAGEQ